MASFLGFCNPIPCVTLLRSFTVALFDMGIPLPEKLMGTCATLAALSILTFALRCYVRTRIVKNWGLDDTVISIAFVSL
jgi:hypothetical protein